MTKVLKESDIAEIVGALKNGEIVAGPTDTVYGFFGDATNEKAIQRIFEIKGREQNKSLPVFVQSIVMAKQLAHVSDEQEEFLKEVWPGKVTVVLKSKGVLSEQLEQEGKIALRIPDYEFVSNILEAVHCPLTGTSANISGKPSCRSAEEIVEQFKDSEHQQFILVDAGQLPDSKPSTIIDITQKNHVIIRK